VTRPLARLPFVAGLDRASSALVVTPTAKADVRNLYSREGTLALRPGLSLTAYPVIPWGTDTIAIGQLTQTKDLLYVVFDRVSRDVRLYRVNPIAAPTIQAVLVNATPKWGTLDPAAVVSAHHVRRAGGRALPRARRAGDDVPVADDLLSARRDRHDRGHRDDAHRRHGWRRHAGPGQVPRRRRAHRCALGLGVRDGRLGGAQDQQHIVHVSVSGDPFTFPPENYFLVGAKSDPVIACVPAADLLAVRKPTQGFRITGTSPEDYAIAPTDALFGCEAARLAIAVGTVAYIWANAGPRRVLGDGSSVDIGVPLDLAGPSPETLAASGALRRRLRRVRSGDEGAGVLLSRCERVEHEHAHALLRALARGAQRAARVDLLRAERRRVLRRGDRSAEGGERARDGDRVERRGGGRWAHAGRRGAEPLGHLRAVGPSRRRAVAGLRAAPRDGDVRARDHRAGDRLGLDHGHAAELSPRSRRTTSPCARTALASSPRATNRPTRARGPQERTRRQSERRDELWGSGTHVSGVAAHLTDGGPDRHRVHARRHDRAGARAALAGWRDVGDS
jgi:hypothetical protein